MSRFLRFCKKKKISLKSFFLVMHIAVPEVVGTSSQGCSKAAQCALQWDAWDTKWKQLGTNNLRQKGITGKKTNSSIGGTIPSGTLQPLTMQLLGSRKAEVPTPRSQHSMVKMSISGSLGRHISTAHEPPYCRDHLPSLQMLNVLKLFGKTPNFTFQINQELILKTWLSKEQSHKSQLPQQKGAPALLQLCGTQHGRRLLNYNLPRGLRPQWENAIQYSDWTWIIG